MLLACWPVFVPTYSHGGLNDCVLSSHCRWERLWCFRPSFLIQHFVFTYLANSAPKVDFSEIGEPGKPTATEVMVAAPSFPNPFPTSPAFDRETPNLISNEPIEVTDQRKKKHLVLLFSVFSLWRDEKVISQWQGTVHWMGAADVFHIKWHDLPSLIQKALHHVSSDEYQGN